MVIAGAGGHSLEVLEVLIARQMTEGLAFFDDISANLMIEGKYPVIKSEEALRAHFSQDARFVLGTGNPKLRKRFFERFTALGGKHVSIQGLDNLCSGAAEISGADIMNRCVIGPKVSIGKGTLVNTGALVHHEVQIGEFCEIAPRAVLLGKVSLGNQVMVGANATILPGIKVGDGAVIGAGAVVTKYVSSGVTVVGVPGKIIKTNE
ncbi:acetyltransferase [Mariniradius sediminis]|uniref:Acetyltransferase n=1 Tax=Mariniradius sediminis TaxID=2909237 RepID=A0ABS9BSJ9_9BACT|nr:acetyltransferase [Mariniradius sediminis]MCF1750320.1 acetyltransferase [Mariniradius sediminis]